MSSTQDNTPPCPPPSLTPISRHRPPHSFAAWPWPSPLTGPLLHSSRSKGASRWGSRGRDSSRGWLPRCVPRRRALAAAAALLLLLLLLSALLPLLCSQGLLVGGWASSGTNRGGVGRRGGRSGGGRSMDRGRSYIFGASGGHSAEDSSGSSEGSSSSSSSGKGGSSSSSSKEPLVPLLDLSSPRVPLDEALDVQRWATQPLHRLLDSAGRRQQQQQQSNSGADSGSTGGSSSSSSSSSCPVGPVRILVAVVSRCCDAQVGCCWHRWLGTSQVGVAYRWGRRPALYTLAPELLLLSF